MKIIKMKNIQIIVSTVVVFLTGCQFERRASAAADFSTPEASFNTSFVAVKDRTFNIALDGMSSEYQNNFGPDRQSQLQTIKSNMGKVPDDPTWERKIVNVEYGNFDGYQAKVFYDEYRKGKLVFGHAMMPMVKEAGQWKIALIKKHTPTPKQVSEAEESKKIFKRNYVLDEKAKIIVEVDKNSSQNGSK